MRVLLVNNFAHITGGADLHCLEITEGLRQRGHEVEWLALSSPSNLEARGAFIKERVSSESRDTLSLGESLDVARRAIWNRDAAAAMRRVHEKFNPDVVHVHKSYVQLSVAPVMIASRAGLPIVQTVHDYEFLSASPLDNSGGRWDQSESRLPFRALNSATFLPRRSIHRPRITSWIAVSRAVRDTYREVGGIDCHVIPNFSAHSEESPLPRAERSGVAYLGRLSQEKGILHVIEVAKARPDIEFSIAGTGPLRTTVEDAAGGLSNLTYLGFLNATDARLLLRRSIACLMPSTWDEPGPLASIEAMSEGTPVICFKGGGLPEYVSDASAGIVCSEPTAAAVTQAVDLLVSDEEIWTECSTLGSRNARSTHSLETYVDRLLAVYNDAIIRT